ncbi:MAG: nicotinate phosphoribosyltransferase [Candidatus Bathyarchaeia archaeon]
MGIALNTDLYELTMAQSYLENGKTDGAVFSLFVRTLPANRNFLVAAGLQTLVERIGEFRFSGEDLAYLEGLKRFSADFLDYLEHYRFRGNLYAIPEGRIAFQNEPLIQVEASLPEAQILETIVINTIHFQTAIASKAARAFLASGGRRLVDFGLRRAHGLEAGALAARAAFIAGIGATSNLEAGRRFGIPVVGTMAHSYVMVFEEEAEAFEAFARSFPDNAIFLIDTYDTLAAADKVVELAKRGVPAIAVRIDSGDLNALSKEVRAKLDRAGLGRVRIIASGGLDERDVEALLRSGAPIDSFAMGTKTVTSADAPYLDIAYKLVEYKGEPKSKASPGKATFPYKRQVIRHYKGGLMDHDEVVRYDECLEGGLVAKVMESGKVVYDFPSLEALHRTFLEDVAKLPRALRGLGKADYEVVIRP